jgi:phage major head subunit gpT-like protein
MQTAQYGALDNRNLIGIWDQMYEPALNGMWATRIGNVVNSTLGTETYGWLGAAPGLEVMTADNPTEEQIKAYTYVLTNIEYAKALKIAEKDMRRDKLGQIQMRIGEMASKAAEHWNKLAAGVLIANPTGYDGVSLFSTAHPESGTSQVNDVTVTQVPSLDVTTATAPTPVEAAAALNGVIGQFYTLTDDKTDPINGQAKSFTVLAGTTAIWAALNYAANATTFAGGQSNQLQGLAINNGIKINVELSPLLAAKTDGFYVFRDDGPVKALILQNEVDVQPVVSDRSNDEYIKFRRFLFSIYTSRAVGLARWQSAIRATFS